MITFGIDQLSQANVEKLLEIQYAPQAAKALNQAAAAAKMTMAAAIAADLGAKVSVVKPFLWIQPATADRLEARVYPKGKAGIPLIKLGASGPDPSRGQGAGVSVGGKVYSHAFIATMPGGHRGVFERAGRTYGSGSYRRLPIKELKTESIPNAFRRLRAIGAARGHEALMTDLQAGLQSALSKKSA